MSNFLVKPGSKTLEAHQGFGSSGEKSLSLPGGESETLMGFLLSGALFSKHRSAVRARTDTANGPAWAALKKHWHFFTRSLANRPFCQGPSNHADTAVGQVCMRVNDILKGLWDMEACLGEGRKPRLSTLGEPMAKKLCLEKKCSSFL